MEVSENSVWKLLTDLSSKKGITEIVINGPKNVFIERGGEFIQLNVSLSKADLFSFSSEVAQYNKKTFDNKNCLFDGNLPDGSRINIIGPPYSVGNISITIRKYVQSVNSFDDNNTVFGLNAQWVALLKVMVNSRFNIMVSGGTGVGKTTFLNLLLHEIPWEERVITLEDTMELKLNIPNCVRLEHRKGDAASMDISMSDLVKNTLRMRPDRIIIGETRGPEIFDLFQAMNTGHEGSMSSIHANSSRDCLKRMETLFMLAGHEIPLKAIRSIISESIDFIVQLSRTRDGQRIIKEIHEVTGMEGDVISLQTIARRQDDTLTFTGLAPNSAAKMVEHGLPKSFFSTL